ncbi:hypothetical protein SBA7_520036 [Candidatus Sulfotelmatobacter sp. SbA7]|nr:hypothetical protein SBA7_520036 [Candidatus Sulfotelmatobacter sp. SbA7]
MALCKTKCLFRLVKIVNNGGAEALPFVFVDCYAIQPPPTTVSSS